MSLRDEIYEWISTYTSAQGSYRDEYTNAVLKMFEKRIDLRIQFLKDRKPLMCNFKIDELENVKEMLK